MQEDFHNNLRVFFSNLENFTTDGQNRLISAIPEQNGSKPKQILYCIIFAFIKITSIIPKSPFGKVF
jgi:hypothetical protein